MLNALYLAIAGSDGEKMEQLVENPATEGPPDAGGAAPSDGQEVEPPVENHATEDPPDAGGEASPDAAGEPRHRGGWHQGRWAQYSHGGWHQGRWAQGRHGGWSWDER